MGVKVADGAAFVVAVVTSGRSRLVSVGERLVSVGE